MADKSSFEQDMKDHIVELLVYLFQYWPEGLNNVLICSKYRLFFQVEEHAMGEDHRVLANFGGFRVGIPLYDFFNGLSFEEKVDFMSAFYSYVGRRVSGSAG